MGVLPAVNSEAIRKAITFGKAIQAEFNEVIFWDWGYSKAQVSYFSGILLGMLVLKQHSLVFLTMLTYRRVT